NGVLEQVGDVRLRIRGDDGRDDTLRDGELRHWDSFGVRALGSVYGRLSRGSLNGTHVCREHPTALGSIPEEVAMIYWLLRHWIVGPYITRVFRPWVAGLEN